MIDLCYQDFDLNDVTKAFGIKKGDAAAVARLSEFVAKAFEAKTINWRILEDGSIFRRTLQREVFKPEVVIGDMIEFVQHSDRIY